MSCRVFGCVLVGVALLATACVPGAQSPSPPGGPANVIPSPDVSAWNIHLWEVS